MYAQEKDAVQGGVCACGGGGGGTGGVEKCIGLAVCWETQNVLREVGVWSHSIQGHCRVDGDL
jgi:hypothetical protein